MDQRERYGMPVFLGALRARLILGCDDRVLFLVGIISLFGIFSPLLFLVAGGLFLFGRIVGAVSPYFFDELSVYFNWRIFAWHGIAPDDAPCMGGEPTFIGYFKRSKA